MTTPKESGWREEVGFILKRAYSACFIEDKTPNEVKVSVAHYDRFLEREIEQALATAIAATEARVVREMYEIATVNADTYEGTEKGFGNSFVKLFIEDYKPALFSSKT
jgi:hypothetical protein